MICMYMAPWMRIIHHLHTENLPELGDDALVCRNGNANDLGGIEVCIKIG